MVGYTNMFANLVRLCGGSHMPTFVFLSNIISKALFCFTTVLDVVLVPSNKYCLLKSMLNVYSSSILALGIMVTLIAITEAKYSLAHLYMSVSYKKPTNE